MAKSLQGKVVVVTGAAHGVGRAIAESFGKQLCKVALIARTAESLEHAAHAIRGFGGEALVLPLDVADAEAVENAAAMVEQTWGHIDVWVNDAMVSVFSPALQMTPEEYKRVTEVNYLGTVYGTMAALKRMTARNEGVVIQIGSALARRSIPLQSAYCASKAAIRGFTDSIRSELLHDKSRVKLSMLILPAVNTPQFDVVRTRLPNLPQPVPPIYQPEVIADAALYAARYAPRQITIGYSVMKALFAQKFFPSLADFILAKQGYSKQQTDEPASPERLQRDDVFHDLPGDFGAHGRFDSRARSFSTQLWARTHPKLVASVLGATAVAAFAGYRAVRA